MKTITRERTSVEKYNVYVANDGTEFNNEDECRLYDKSAKGVLNATLRKFMVRKGCEDSMFCFGSCENIVEIYRPTCEEHKKSLLQMYLFMSPHVQGNESLQHLIDRTEGLIDRAIKENDYLIVSRGCEGCEDDFWLYGTLNSLHEDAKKFCQQEKEKENA